MPPLANSLKQFFNVQVAKRPFAGSSDAKIDAQLHELCRPRLSQSDEVPGRISQDRVKRISATLEFLDTRDPSVRSRDWYRRPRLYAILRTIGALQLMDDFIAQGVSDFFLPFSHHTLPSFVHDCGQDGAFLEIQDYYLSDIKDIETESLDHKYIEDGNACFRPKEKLGQGGFGAVDLVFSTLSFKMYARKRVPRGRPSENSLHAQKSMVQELKHLKRLDHRHLVKIVGSYTDKSYIAYLMVPIAKYTLDHFLRTTKALTETHRDSLRRWYGCLAGAVQYLHSHKIRHRDLTCRNVLITDDDEIRISDFGTAYNWSDRLSSNTRHLSTHVSRDYMAPEVARHDERGSASDMWSLGIIYLRMTTRLLGHKLAVLQSHIDRSAKELNVQPYVYANMHVVTKWLANLSENNNHAAHDNEPIIWVRSLLQEVPVNRQDAKFLMQDILESPSFDKFCCFNCHDDFRQGSFAYDDDGDTYGQAKGETYTETMDYMATLFQEDATPKMSDRKSASIHQWMSEGTSAESSSASKNIDHSPVDMLATEWTPFGMATKGQLSPDEQGDHPLSTLHNYDRWQANYPPGEEDYDYDDGFYSANSDLGFSTDGEQDVQSSKSDSPDKSPRAQLDFRDSGLGFNEYESGSSLADGDNGRLFDEVSDRPDSESEDEEEDGQPQTQRFRSALDVVDESPEDFHDQSEDESKNHISEGDALVFTEICDESESDDDSAISPTSSSAGCDDRFVHITEAAQIQTTRSETFSEAPGSSHQPEEEGPGAAVVDNDTPRTNDIPEDRDSDQRTSIWSLWGTPREPATSQESNEADGGPPKPSECPGTEFSGHLDEGSETVLDDPATAPTPETISKIPMLPRQAESTIPPTNDPKGDLKSNVKPKKKVRIAEETSQKGGATKVAPVHNSSPDSEMRSPWGQWGEAEDSVPLSSSNIRRLNETHGKRPPPIDPKGYLKKAWDSASNAPTSVISVASKERLAIFMSRLLFQGSQGNVLYIACKNGESRKLRALLEHGCNPGSVARPRPKPMLSAVGGATDNHRKCVRQLIKFGGNVNVRAKKTRQTPLHIAVLNPEFPGYAKLVRLLIEAGADVNARDANKDRPLALLFQKGVEKKPMPLTIYRRQALAILLQSDAEVNFGLLGTGETPLHLAVRRQDPYAVAMLIYKGADVRVKNTAGASPLQITANQFRGGELAPDHAQVLEGLVRKGKEIIDEPAGASGRTALHLAVLAGTPGAVAILLEFGASPTVCDSSGRSAIQLAQKEMDEARPGDIGRRQDRGDILTMLTVSKY